MIHPKKLLERHQLEPRKSLGQNFLFDDQILNRLCEIARLDKQDRVLEIGAGLGSLTSHLSANAGEVIAIETDRRLMPVLATELRNCSNVKLIHEDFLRLDLADCIASPYKVVANVPYYITGAILRHLFAGENRPSLVVMTVQREVAERIIAQPPKMSLLALGVQYFGTASLITTIKAGAFWPRPDVDSAVLLINLKGTDRQAALGSEALFFQVARAGFSQKRKQLKNNLRQLGRSDQELEQALGQAEIDGRRRAETVSLNEWHRLVLALGAGTKTVQ